MAGEGVKRAWPCSTAIIIDMPPSCCLSSCLFA